MNIVMEQNELPELRLHVRTQQWATAIKTLCDRQHSDGKMIDEIK
jgi:hypothetical protein